MVELYSLNINGAKETLTEAAPVLFAYTLGNLLICYIIVRFSYKWLNKIRLQKDIKNMDAIHGFCFILFDALALGVLYRISPTLFFMSLNTVSILWYSSVIQQHNQDSTTRGIPEENKWSRIIEKTHEDKIISENTADTSNDQKFSFSLDTTSK